MENWHALYTKPHKEHHVSSFLRGRGVETYLPTVRVTRNGRRRTESFFSCYLFARFDAADSLPGLQWTPGLRRIVSFGSQPAMIPDEVISSVQKRLSEVVELTDPVCCFEKGDRLAIKSGPFLGFDAIFEQSLSSRDRAQVLVEFLGRLTRCEVPLECMERVHRRRARH